MLPSGLCLTPAHAGFPITQRLLYRCIHVCIHILIRKRRQRARGLRLAAEEAGKQSIHVTAPMLARSLSRRLLWPIQQSARAFTALPAEDHSGVSSSVQQEVCLFTSMLLIDPFLVSQHE